MPPTPGGSPVHTNPRKAPVSLRLKSKLPDKPLCRIEIIAYEAETCSQTLSPGTLHKEKSKTEEPFRLYQDVRTHSPTRLSKTARR